MPRQLEMHEQIERSILTTYRAKVYSKFIQAIKEYELISPNDKIAVCISGGKDSMLLAKCFQELLRHSDFEFEVKYMVMNPGYSKENLEKIINNAALMKLPITIVDSDIFECIKASKEKPCYMCARMRRGVLYKKASELGCNKIALGHHFDDVIETIVMGMFYNGRFQTMLPKLKSQNYPGMELIRPFYFVHEKDIINWAKFNNLSFLNCACSLTAATTEDFEESASKRKEIKNLIKKLKTVNKTVDSNIFASSKNVNMDLVLGYKKDGIQHDFLEIFDEVKADE